MNRQYSSQTTLCAGEVGGYPDMLDELAGYGSIPAIQVVAGFDSRVHPQLAVPAKHLGFFACKATDRDKGKDEKDDHESFDHSTSRNENL
jgi:hypothetical protein